MAREMTIRPAKATEAVALEALQRRSSDVWATYRAQLAAHPDAIELPQAFIDAGWVRVAVSDGDTPLGFSVVIPGDRGIHDLDGLFVDPDYMGRGVGRALVEDAAARASASGASSIDVIAGPARGFYERLGFGVIATAETRFGSAVRMRRAL
jgi:GNAT superfamily N-acetyltransferase